MISMISHRLKYFLVAAPLFFLWVLPQAVAFDARLTPVFEVQATSIKSLFINSEGKVKKHDGGDQVIYQVDMPNKIVRRIAVFHAPEKSNDYNGRIRRGLTSDKTIYDIVFF